MRDISSGKLMIDMITDRKVQSFCEGFRIVSRGLTGIVQTSLERESCLLRKKLHIILGAWRGFSGEHYGRKGCQKYR